SEQGREVFFTYASTVDRAAERLVVAIESDNGGAAQSELRKIAEACNSCHHFFRLKIEDSVVPSSTTSQVLRVSSRPSSRGGQPPR
ncbi:MAG TPA: hypothetical protein VKZ63_05010, partial [Kofleriaceae bacterium]|nr:hypothetical protein [Kofleriaceae bacterium]